MGIPRRRPTAIRMTSSSIHNPTEDIGGALNHAPVSLAETAKSIARHLLFQEDACRGVFHAFCIVSAGGIGEGREV